MVIGLNGLTATMTHPRLCLRVASFSLQQFTLYWPRFCVANQSVR